MPNIKSAKKRVELSKISNARNKMYKSTLKSTLKKFDTAVAEGDREKADSAYKAPLRWLISLSRRGSFIRITLRVRRAA